MNGTRPCCGDKFPLIKRVIDDRPTVVLASHDDERGNCPGSGKEPKEWPVEESYHPAEDDSGGFGGGFGGGF